MIKTSTPSLTERTPETEEAPLKAGPEFAEPSAHIIQNILNFSKSLEIRRSELVQAIEVVRS